MWVSFFKKRYKIHTTVKMINIKVKEKILRASREERDYNQKRHGKCQLNSHLKRKGIALGYLHVSERIITANLELITYNMNIFKNKGLGCSLVVEHYLTYTRLRTVTTPEFVTGKPLVSKMIKTISHSGRK